MNPDSRPTLTLSLSDHADLWSYVLVGRLAYLGVMWVLADEADAREDVGDVVESTDLGCQSTNMNQSCHTGHI